MITFTDTGARRSRSFWLRGTRTSRPPACGSACGAVAARFRYALAFDTQRDGDELFEDHGLRLLVDGPSLPYVRGAVVDYVEGLQGAGFKVDNPNVVAACGCGSSFRVAEEEEVSAV